MNKYDFIGTGAVCPNCCEFCLQCGGTDLPLQAVNDAIAGASRPYNLYFGEGNAAGYTHLLQALESVPRGALRRAKVKTTGASLLQGDRLQELVRHGVLLYEVEFLGPNEVVHDGIARRTGAFSEASRTVTLIRQADPSDPAARQRFLFLTVPIFPGNVQHVRAITDHLRQYRPDRIVYRFGGGVRFSNAISAIQGCLAELVQARIWPVLSGFPFCVIPGLEYHCQEVYDRQVFASPQGFCEPCVFKQICCGVGADYLTTFGHDGLEAIRYHPRAESIHRIAGMETILLPGKPQER